MTELRDLSHRLDSGRPYPGDPEATVTPHATMGADGYRVAEIACSTHSGTHVDAPSHLVGDGDSLGAFDAADFRFSARLADCTGFGSRDVIPADAVPATDADAVVFHTGWSDYWGDPAYFDHPYLSRAAAERCAEQDCAVAVDAPSVDPSPTENATGDEPAGFPAHDALLGAGRPILENATNLAGLPERFTLHAYPLPVDADGAPVRAVAEL